MGVVCELDYNETDFDLDKNVRKLGKIFEQFAG